MEKDHALPILEKHGVILNGHFLLRSGSHAPVYVNKDRLYVHTNDTAKLCAAIAEHFAGRNIQVVAGPEKGGIILAQWVANHLDKFTPESVCEEVLAVYAEKTPAGGFAFGRGQAEYLPGRRVLVVEDVLTTGGSVREVVRAVRDAGGEVAAVGALVNRGFVTAYSLTAPELYSVLNLLLENWTEAECPLCQRGMPLNTDVGRGKELAKAG